MLIYIYSQIWLETEHLNVGPRSLDSIQLKSESYPPLFFKYFTYKTALDTLVPDIALKKYHSLWCQLYEFYRQRSTEDQRFPQALSFSMVEM